MPARQPEVGQVAVVATVDEDVRRLDVAVNEASLVGRVEGICDLPEQGHGAIRRKHPLRGEQPLQVAAVDQPHREIKAPGHLTRVVDRNDRGVIERGCQPRLAQEALAEANIPGELRCEELERYMPLQGEIARPVDDTHAAATKQRLDPVAGKLGSGGEFRHTPPFGPTIRPSTSSDQLAAETEGPW